MEGLFKCTFKESSFVFNMQLILCCNCPSPELRFWC